MQGRLLAQVSVLAAMLVAIVAIGPAPAASAAEYEVEICTPTSTARDGVEILEEAGSSRFFTTGCILLPGKENVLDITGQTSTVVGGAHWKLNAPPNTLIHTVEANRFLTPDAHSWAHGLRWVVFGGPPDEELFESDDVGFIPADERVTWALDSGSVTGRLFCPLASCNDDVDEVQVFFGNMIAHMEDLAAPTVSAAGSLLAGGPVRGTKQVSFSAADQGSGIAAVGLFLDERRQALMTDDNGGHCAKPYKFLVPCKTAITSSFSVDTTGLAEGDHKVQVAVEDAAGQVAVSPLAIVTVHNAPTNTARPVLSGVEKLGGQLVAMPGAWEGSPTFAYQWLRCPASVTTGKEAASCKAIAGATKPQYEPTGPDVFQRDMAMVTATNAKGSEAAFSRPSSPIADSQGHTAAADTTPPALSNVSLSRKRFRVGKKPAGKAGKKGGGGTVLRITSSEAGQLSIQIDRVIHAHKPKRVGRLSATIGAGQNKATVSGRIGRKKAPLAPGSYRMTITARDTAGNVSKAVTLPFTILPR
jgi:hypothetical protein